MVMNGFSIKRKRIKEVRDYLIKQSSNPISFYFHLPFCVDRCIYCDFVTVSYRHHLRKEYEKRIYIELNHWLTWIQDSPVRTLYFGGGTPSLCQPEFIGDIVHAVTDRQDTDLLEVTLEATPSTLTSSRVLKYMEAGINRFSVGFQSLDDGVLKQMGRRHNRMRAEYTAHTLSEAGVNWNADFMIGVPGEPPGTAEDILRFIEKYRPTHVSIYHLEIHHGTILAEAIRNSWLKPENDDRLIERWNTLRIGLKSLGYHHYEVSNFALPGFESLHNRIYWQVKDYIGLGVSAHSCAGPYRWFHTPYLTRYTPEKKSYWENLSVEKRTRREYLRERCLLGLRTCRGIPLSLLRAYDDRIDYQRVLRRLKRHGWMVKRKNRWVCTPRGWLQLNQIYHFLGLV